MYVDIYIYMYTQTYILQIKRAGTDHNAETRASPTEKRALPQDPRGGFA